MNTEKELQESENTTSETTFTSSESMDDYKDVIDRSFRSIKEGDMITGTILDIAEEGITLDIGYFTDGFIAASEISNDPTFSAMEHYRIGDSISALVIDTENEQGSIALSIKESAELFSWDKLKEAMNEEKVFHVHIAETVPAGLIAYVENIRGFIPISQISTEHVEDTSVYANQAMDVLITTVDPAQNKLILSAKKLLQQKAMDEKNAIISSLQKGLITTGTVEKIVPYGAFVRIEDDLSGLVHISEICGRRLQSPKEVLHEGDTVTVKIIQVADGKISLSIKQAENNLEKDEVVEHISDVPTEYTSEESASTSLASLLAKLK